MKKYYSLLIAFAFVWGCKPAKPPTARDILNNVLSAFNAHKSVSYNVTYKVKTFSNDKPYVYNVHCDLIRDNKDSLFNGYIWHSCSNFGGFENYYNLVKIYHISDSAKKITEYDDVKSDFWAMTGNLSDGANDIDFLRPSKLADILKDSSITDSLTIDKLDYVDYWKVTIKYPDDKELSNRWWELWINRKDTTLKKMYYHAVYQQQAETKEWNIDSMLFDKVTPAMLEAKLKNKLSAYTLKQYVPRPPDYYNLLDSGTIAPAFTGMDFQTGKPFTSSQFKGKVTVLDFWYMDCPWCIKAMPDLEKIYTEYKSKGLAVLGINSHDTTAKAKKRLPVFVSINKMNYDAVLTSRKTDSLFKVKEYPTLYIIDKKGKVAFTAIGYSNHLDSLLNVVIPKELAK